MGDGIHAVGHRHQLRVEGGDDELGALVHIPGLGAQEVRHHGPVAMWKARQRMTGFRTKPCCTTAGKPTSPLPCMCTILPRGSVQQGTCTAGRAPRRSRRRGRRARGRTSGYGGRGCGRALGEENGPRLLMKATPVRAGNPQFSGHGAPGTIPFTPAPTGTWMAKMRVSATSVFWPPDSCLRDMVSPPAPKATWGIAWGPKGAWSWLRQSTSELASMCCVRRPAPKRSCP